MSHPIVLYAGAQMAQTAVCNRHHALNQQLCRWLLPSLDRLLSDELVMTQEFIANMLGVRREGVSEATGKLLLPLRAGREGGLVATAKLQRAGLIYYSRGHIPVIDRALLKARRLRAPFTAAPSIDLLKSFCQFSSSIILSVSEKSQTRRISITS